MAGNNINVRRNFIPFAISLLIAVTLWFLNTLNKEYSSEYISFPIKYADLPKDKYLVSELPKTMTLEVKGQGFAILRKKITTSFLPIILNVHNDILKGGDIRKITYNTSVLKDKIANELGSSIKLLSIQPEIINFEFSYYETKSVPVIPHIEYSLKRQYILKDSVNIFPVRVEVKGPAAILDTLTAIHTKEIRFEELTQDLKKTVPFVEINGVRIEEEGVTVEISIERHTELKKSIPLQIKNLPYDRNLRLFPSSIDVTFNVGLSMYDHVRDSSFVIGVDYNNISDTTRTLPVIVEKEPYFIKDLVCTPERVEFLIEMK